MRALQLADERARELRRRLLREDVEAHDAHASRSAAHLERRRARARLAPKPDCSFTRAVVAAEGDCDFRIARAVEESRDGEQALSRRRARGLLRESSRD